MCAGAGISTISALIWCMCGRARGRVDYCLGIRRSGDAAGVGRELGISLFCESKERFFVGGFAY